ncbi:drug/metabolite transporter (DMT)-like permease [Kibdelosporangium banguiense]|uniref:Drug/metabolite transporter (DMT)-like permease n=1 Tax=Kibdelosporangium banguiense TaxID=1365924 RepID=A0ABS4T8U8_9PSEU|nr:DMT family transporter [Kibdelosporangium banguiense]MBP2320845.1 drug/metabolite transporter (DMT)-like permease [Kibdelosporangium banguiense]
MNKAMVGAAFASVLVGASVPITGMLDGYPVLAGQAIRYGIAAVALLIWLKGRLPMPSARDIPGLIAMVVAGMLGFNAAILLAQRYATPGFVAAMLGGSPLVLAIVVPALRGRRPNARALIGATLVVLGVAVLTGGGSWHGPGLALALLVLVCEVAFTLGGVGVTRRLGATAASTWACIGAAVGGALITTGENAWSRPTWRELIALTVLGTLVTAVAFVLWYTGVSVLGADRAGVLIGLMPLSGLGVAVIVGAQALTITALGGAVVVAAGCVLGLSVRAPSATRPAPDRVARR